MPAAQAGGARAAERRAVLPARPSGPAPVLGDAGRRSRGAKSPKTRSASAGSVVQLARCGEVASQRHASMHGGPVKPNRLLTFSNARTTREEALKVVGSCAV